MKDIEFEFAPFELGPQACEFATESAACPRSRFLFAEFAFLCVDSSIEPAP